MASEEVQSFTHYEALLALIIERKSKKQSCERESLKQESSKRYGMNEQEFEIALYHLIHEEMIYENIRGGKKTYAPKETDLNMNKESNTNTSHNINLTNVSESSEFIDFKRFSFDNFCKLNSKMENLQHQFEKFESTLEMKDHIIDILQKGA